MAYTTGRLKSVGQIIAHMISLEYPTLVTFSIIQFGIDMEKQLMHLCFVDGMERSGHSSFNHKVICVGGGKLMMHQNGMTEIREDS